MNAKNLWAAFVRSPTSIKLLTIMVILIWLIPFVMIIAGLIFFLESPGAALEATPRAAMPTIVLEPPIGPVGTVVRVHGEGWPAGNLVSIHLMTPIETAIPTYAVTSVVADQAGRFLTEFVVPAESRWAGQTTALVVARTDAGEMTAGASFALLGQVGPTTGTVEPTREAAELIPPTTPTVIPPATEEPTPTVEPTATATPVVQLPTATPQPAQPLVTSTTDLNIRSGPGMAYAIIGLLQTGQTAEVTGLSPDGGWWQIKFSGTADGRGWVSAKYVTAQNVSNVPVVQAPALPATPTPVPPPPPPPPPVISDWRGEYFDNRNLAGPPILVRNDVTIDFNWGTGSPAPGLPADNFSARWSRSWNFSEGVHRFHTVVDDGVRLYVDDALVIDSWQDGGWREVVGERWLWGGNHNLRVEYYEHSGDALIRVWSEKVSAPAPPNADFDADPRSGNVPLRVEFDNDSDGNYDRCEWDFGDDHDSDDCDEPHHTYKEAGQYTVRLKIWGPGGSDSKKREDYITVRPVAQFDASPKSGSKPLTVSFINQSTPYDLSEWDFGDGQTSIEQNPTHTYPATGVYTVRLRVKEADVWSDYQTKANFIVVTELPPVAAFTANPTSGAVPLNVQFTDQSSGVITAWSWDFGDGTTSTLQSPAHTYVAAGIYSVSLTVSGPGGSDSETKPNFITVIAVPPEAQFTAMPTSGTAPLAVAFTDQSLGTIVNWLWNFGDGQTSPEKNPSHTYLTSGQYTVSLTVSGPAGSDTETKANYITVTEPPPVADFAASPTGGPRPLTVNFTDQSTGTITTWLWDFGDGNTGAEKNPTHTYTTVGKYTINLTVTGPGGSNTLTRLDYIIVAEPVQAKFKAEPTQGPAPLTVQFSDTSTGDYDACTWDFGDGKTSTDENPTHIYDTAGIYTISLTVSGPGGSDTKTEDGFITVIAPPAPKAKFSADPTRGQVPLTVQFTDNSEGDISSWLWEFGDGATDTVQHPAHTYMAAGEYTVSLTVSGPGGSDTKTKDRHITVTEPPPAADFSANPISGPQPLAVNFTDQSAGVIGSWWWDFGDESTSSEKNPTHTYEKVGSYTVSLTVSGPGGNDTETKTGYITVTPPPTPVQADFSGNPTSGQAPLTVNFTNLSSGDYDACTWDFGWGGATSNDCGNPSFTYQEAGLYTVSLTVSGPGGNDTETKTGYITVTPPPAPLRVPEIPTPTLEPPTPTPEPPTPTPEPPTPTPEPPTPTPEPPTPIPEPPTPVPPPPEPPTPIPTDTPTPLPIPTPLPTGEPVNTMLPTDRAVQ